jgi:hypothetical protein
MDLAAYSLGQKKRRVLLTRAFPGFRKPQGRERSDTPFTAHLLTRIDPCFKFAEFGKVNEMWVQ